MLELLSSWSILLLCVGLIFVFFWRDGRETSEKLSSSRDSEKYLPAEHDRGEGNVNNVETRSNAKTLSELPLARDRVINREEEEEEEKESLRRRISGRKTDEQNESIGRGDGSNSPLKEKQIGSTGRNLPCQQHTDSVESREEVTESPEVVPTEAANESGKEKEGVRREIQHVANVNNTGTTDRTSNVSVCSTSKESDRADSSGDYQRQEVLRVPEIVLSKQVPECSEEKDALGEDPTADHANNIEHAVNFLSKELGADDNCLIQEEVTKDKLSEIVPSEATVELKEQGNCVLEEVPVVNNKLDIERFDDLSHNLHTDKVDISTRSSIENRTRDSALESSPKRIDEDETSNFGAGTSCALVDSHANEKQPKSAVVERFSDKLCKSVLDAVIHDKHLPPSKSEKETETENAVWRFSSILADSIVKTVLDYSKINQAHIVKSDENCNLAKNIPHVSNDNDEGTEDETVCELKSTGEGVCNVGKTSVDDASLKDLDEYAKKLSEQIISEVYQLNGLCHVPVKCSSTEVYASELTETILSDAIEGAKCSMLEDKSLNSIDRTHESSLDTFLDEIVGNVLKSVILRIAMEDQVEHAGARGDGGNDQSECGYHGDENRNSGKFQSKWITEDDLDELHEDDLSEEEGLNANGCNSSDNLTKKETGAFWRKSLIQDLDDDLEFEELESQSSAPSSPTKSANFEMNEFVADSTDDEEVYDTSPDAKVPTTSSMSKTYTSNRSRLRSGESFA